METVEKILLKLNQGNGLYVRSNNFREKNVEYCIFFGFKKSFLFFASALTWRIADGPIVFLEPIANIFLRCPHNKGDEFHAFHMKLISFIILRKFC
jgi:hypothetical protein